MEGREKDTALTRVADEKTGGTTLRESSARTNDQARADCTADSNHTVGERRGSADEGRRGEAGADDDAPCGRRAVSRASHAL